jgi:hypothetical protein
MVHRQISDEDREVRRRLVPALRRVRDTAGPTVQTVTSASGLSIEAGRTTDLSCITVTKVVDAPVVGLEQLRGTVCLGNLPWLCP